MDKLFNAAEFGKRLKTYRKKKHLSQMDLAELIGTAPSSVSHLENGTHSPSLETLLKLSAALNCGIDDMLCDSLPAVRDIHLDKDFEKLLSSCTTSEKRMLYKILDISLKALKEEKISH